VLIFVAAAVSAQVPVETITDRSPSSGMDGLQTWQDLDAWRRQYAPRYDDGFYVEGISDFVEFLSMVHVYTNTCGNSCLAGGMALTGKSYAVCVKVLWFSRPGGMVLIPNVLCGMGNHRFRESARI
jgi:hypothetical protein